MNYRVRSFVSGVALILVLALFLVTFTDANADDNSPVLFICYNANQDNGIYLMLQNTEPGKAIGLIFNSNGIYINKANFGYEPVSDSWIAMVNNTILVVSTKEIPMTIRMTLPDGATTLECR